MRPLAPRDQHVGGLHVAMDQAANVGGVERGGGLRHDLGGQPGIERAVNMQQGAEVVAINEAHGDIELPVIVLAGVIDGDHVGVVDPGGGERLAHEALAELRLARELGRYDLERDGALERGITRPVHHAHAAAARDVLDAIAGDGRADEPNCHPLSYSGCYEDALTAGCGSRAPPRAAW